MVVGTSAERSRPRDHEATLRRSIALFRAFRQEQSRPDLFYTALAQDSVRELGDYLRLDERVVLDVGGGPGWFADAFRSAGATYLTVDAHLGELSAAGSPPSGSALGSALALPVRSSSVDLCYSSNVLEHVADPWVMCEEMLRVTRPGGITAISFTTWWGPWGGHETAPWHYLGGARAAQRYARQHGVLPKNEFGATLFPVSVAAALRWAKTTPSGTLLRAYPRYHPWWARGVVRIPLVRELVTWNLMLVLRAS